MDLRFFSIPFNSPISLVDEQRLDKLVRTSLETPEHIRAMLLAPTTGAVLRGTARSFNVPVESTPQLAYAVLRVAVGELELAKLGAMLSAELKLPNDKAQAIAKEIEKELFSPVMLELNEWLEKQKKQSTQQPAGVKNVVDLKNKNP